MSLGALADGLAAVLTADADLAAWAQARGQPWTVLLGNVPVAQVAQSQRPALVIELGDADTDPALLGAAGARVQQDFLLSLLWTEQDRGQAFEQRIALPERLLQALLRAPDLNGEAEEARLEGWSSDRGANHPTQILRAVVTCELLIRRTP